MGQQNSELHYVVLVDIINSRKIEDRESFEAKLERALEYVNTNEEQAISTPFTQMKGIDEFGCVLTNLGPIPDILSEILNRIHPSKGRFAIASGEIDIGATRSTVAKMDGPAFHRASSLLEDVENSDLFVGIDTGQEVDEVVSSALNLLILDREQLTDRQVEVILAYEKYGTQSKAGDGLGLRQQAVSKSLQRANYVRRSKIRENLRQSMTSIYD